MKVVVLQSNYIPWRGYFRLIQQADLFCFYDEVQFTKNDWRNRNQIAGNGEPFWLTIPVGKDSVNQKISEVIPLDFKWQKKHLNQISQTYSKAPFKDEILELIAPIYGKQHSCLSEFNQAMIQSISNHMGLTTQFVNSKNYTLDGDRVNKLISLVQQLEGQTYISGPAAKEYLSGKEMLFSNSNIELKYCTYDDMKPYSHFKNNYQKHISIIDLLMNVPKNELTEYL